MPELPEVQTVVDNLNNLGLVGRSFTGAQVFWPKSIAVESPGTFIDNLKGLRIRHIARRGKYIVMHLSRGWTLLIHLRMTGRLNWSRREAVRSKHEHVILQLKGSHDLRFQDTRKFGRILLTRTPDTVLGKLGPEPLAEDFSIARFRTMLQRRNRAIKPLLLDQTFIAGLGNIYVDEALWQAGLHPQRASRSLGNQEVGRLLRAIRQALSKGLQNMGTTLGSGAGNFYSVAGRRGRNAEKLKVFRRTGQACSRCGAAIRRIVVAQRGSHICPVCQAAPFRLPDAS